ncbi:type VI secretion system tip protein VgrG [Umezakia ovalisporum]|uniref:Type VI secretion system tip protein VgrG n=1 Tax=Umezakia ovalisporum FSS-43 TaxID=2740520 RepID=A0ABT6K5R1_9CYAN|nr:type VI secretion system tip protein VgrG [Umezakia ovalisporum]MDH6057680.1 type VI secretion system tip protein VgrG [Umezakia ovalisporum FSS-43]
MSARALPTASQTGLVTFTLKVGGRVLGRTYRLKSIVVSREFNRIPKAILTLLDGNAATGEFPVSNEATFLPGQLLEISVGYDSTEEPVFKGLIVKQALRIRPDRSPELTVEARHEAVRMALARRCRYFNDQTDGTVLETLLGDYGLTADVPATETTHAGLVQYHATDWDFLLARAEANGLLVCAGDEAVKAAKPDFSPEPALELTFGATMLAFDAELDARTQPDGLDAQSWQPADGSRLDLPAAEPGLPEAGNFSAVELAASLGQTQTLRHDGGLTPPDLQAWADGRLQRQRLAKLRGRVRFRGCKALNPGDLVALAGVGERFSGTVLVSGVRHEISGGAWTTDVQFGLSPVPFFEETDGLPAVAAPPAGGLLPAVRGLHVGVVTALDDPEGGFRVRVRMPAVGEADEGVWARMALLDAGSNRGTLFRPEVGDEVVVGFFEDDPRFPVVLGGLHSAAQPAPLNPTDANPQKGIFSRENLKLLFDDEKKSIQLETPSGKKITLDEQAGTLQLEDENRNKITLKKSGVTVESGGNLALKAVGTLSLQAAQLSLSANASLAVKATGSLQLESSGTAILKGAVVMIN